MNDHDVGHALQRVLPLKRMHQRRQDRTLCAFDHVATRIRDHSQNTMTSVGLYGAPGQQASHASAGSFSSSFVSENGRRRLEDRLKELPSLSEWWIVKRVHQYHNQPRRAIFSRRRYTASAMYNGRALRTRIHILNAQSQTQSRCGAPTTYHLRGVARNFLFGTSMTPSSCEGRQRRVQRPSPRSRASTQVRFMLQVKVE